MGSVFDVSKPPIMKVSVIGTNQIEKVEIVKDNDVVYSHAIFEKNDAKKNEFPMEYVFRISSEIYETPLELLINVHGKVEYSPSRRDNVVKNNIFEFGNH